jgi:hypothetical protein
LIIFIAEIFPFYKVKPIEIGSLTDSISETNNEKKKNKRGMKEGI